MAYRERIAWMYLLAMLATLGPYLLFALVVQHGEVIPMPGFRQLLIYGIASSAFAILVGVGHIVLRLRYPLEAKESADERDQEIERRSYRVGYIILLTGMIIVGIYKPFIESGWSIVNDGICMIVISETVRGMIIVLNYRRQRV